MKKVTLSADPQIIQQAKDLAAENHTSMSSMFERFIRHLVARRTPKSSLGPIARRASGIIALPAGRSGRQVLEDALLTRHGLKR
jgi:hypothetical protein